MRIIETNGKQIYNWASCVEDGAIEQMKVIMGLPFVEHCSMMPDSHVGMEMPIGGVVATNDVVVPVFVGVDIGCGMCALKTSLKREDIIDENLRKKIHTDILATIPVGFAHNDENKVKIVNGMAEKIVSEFFEVG
jgi:tRNA-splicing ligase RtcB